VEVREQDVGNAQTAGNNTASSSLQDTGLSCLERRLSGQREHFMLFFKGGKLISFRLNASFIELKRKGKFTAW
jgi:hypothetical protein